MAEMARDSLTDPMVDSTRLKGSWYFVRLYDLICVRLLLRIGAGLAIGLHLLRRSPTTGSAIQRIKILESNRVGTPVMPWIVAAIVVLGSPLTQKVAAAQPQNPPPGRSTIGGPVFDMVEVHYSAPNTIPEMRVRFAQGRYE